MYTEAIYRKFVFARPYIFSSCFGENFVVIILSVHVSEPGYGVSVNLQSICVFYANRVQI